VNNRKTRAALLGAVVSLCFISLLLKRVNLGEAWETLRRIDARLLLLPAAMGFLNYPLRALRWQLMFPRGARPDYGLTFRSFAIGTGTNNLVPGRAGDVARCMLIARDTSLTGSSLALGTLAMEKVLDGLALMAIVILACIFISPPGWLTKLIFAGVVVFGAALAVVFALRYRAHWFIGRVAEVLTTLRLHAMARKVPDLFASFAEGLSAISSLTLILWLAAITAVIWLTEAGLVWAIAKPLRLPLSMADSVVVAAVLGLGLMVPAGPASIGTYEFCVVAAMGLAGIASGSALAYAVLLHSWVFVATSFVGLACLAWAGLTLKQLTREEEAWVVRGAGAADERS